MDSTFKSEVYEKIKNNIESTWPEYKIKAANEMIISKHGIKLKSRRDKNEQKEI